MNSKRIIHTVFVVSMILVLGFAVSPASAKAPIHFELPIYWTGTIEDECTFTIYTTSIGTQHSILWRDENGHISMGHNFFNVTETWSANGKTLEFKYNYPVHGWIETYPDGYIAFLGHTMVTLPREGVVYSATGLLTWSFKFDDDENIILLDMLKLVGNWDADWDPICEYLAP